MIEYYSVEKSYCGWLPKKNVVRGEITDYSENEDTNEISFTEVDGRHDYHNNVWKDRRVFGYKTFDACRQACIVMATGEHEKRVQYLQELEEDTYENQSNY